MAKKSLFICAIYLSLTSPSLAAPAPALLPDDHFQNLRKKFRAEYNLDQNQAGQNQPQTNQARFVPQAQPKQNQLQGRAEQFQSQGRPKTNIPANIPANIPPNFSRQVQPKVIPPRLDPRFQAQGRSPQNQLRSNIQEKPLNPCDEIPIYAGQILNKIFKEKSDILSRLPPCFALDRKLILKAVVFDSSQFRYAADILQEDQSFVNRLLKISPDILQYAAPEIRGDESFMEKATYISRDALQYASWSLLDKKLFMKRMINIDSRNYKFSANRLKELPEFAKTAFADNGLLLEFAPEKVKNNRKLVKIAVLSNKSALKFASNRLKKDKGLKKLAKKKTSIKSEEKLEEFLKKNYITKGKTRNSGNIIGNQAKFYKDQQLISRDYVTKWHDHINYSRRQGKSFVKNTNLIAADSRNYHIPWRDDLREHKEIAQKINKFLTKRRLTDNVIDNLSLTYLWKIKSEPQTLALNLYLLRDSTDEDLGPDFSDITSLTAILQKRGKGWKMTIVEVILDSEIKVNVVYPGGHKKHILWDLYAGDKKDKNPKIIFKVEDGLEEYFEIFEEQAGGKYQMVFRSKNLK